jgi:hypothetical protein
MDDGMLLELLFKASVIGTKGQLVVGFLPPRTATDDPMPLLIVKNAEYQATTEGPF